MGVSDLAVQYRSIGEIRAYKRNARTHPAKQIEQLVRSIQEFGFTNPILLSDDGEIVAGHGRLEAAKRLCLDKVPTITLSGLTQDQRKALVLADNRIAEDSGWDKDMLSLELGDLHAAAFDFSSIGFTARELGEFMQPTASAGRTHPDDAPPAGVLVKSAIGDTWRLGEHVVTCGDSKDAESYARVLPGVQADVVWTDPPYNVAYVGKSSKLAGSKKILNDSMTDGDFLQFLECVHVQLFKNLSPGSAIYVAHSDTEGLNFRLAFTKAGFKLSGAVVWVKNMMVLGRADYQGKHEPILYGWKPGASHRWYGGRKETSVKEFGDDSPFTKVDDLRWQLVIGDRTFIVDGAATVKELVPTVIKEDKPNRSDLHPTMKPVALIERMLRNSARPGDVVLDPFGGSGSTLIASERLGMSARLIELSPQYVDVIVRRWQEYTGRKAVRVSDGMEFDHAGTQANAYSSEANTGESGQAAVNA